MSKRIFLIHFILSAGLLLLIPTLCSADAQSQFDTAENFYDQKEYEKAIEYFQKVVDTWPNYEHADKAQFLIGECYEKLRDSGTLAESEANRLIEEVYKILLERYPDSGFVYRCFLKLGWLSFKGANGLMLPATGSCPWRSALRIIGRLIYYTP